VAPSRAIRVHKNGGPEELKLETIEVGLPGPDEVLVRHKAIGLNFTDIHHRTGRYPVTGLPTVIGMEASGVIEAVGSTITEFKMGDRVAYGGASPGLAPGSYSELRVMKPKYLVKIPDWLDYETAAAVILKGLTTQYLLRGAYRLQSGQAVLIHAAAGGVGLLMCQWAASLGAVVIGTVSTAEKAQMAKQNGCAHPIVSTQEDVVARVRELTSGEGVPVVYDAVGASTFETTLACLQTRGTAVCFGSASGPVPPFDIFRLNRMGSLYLTGAGLADYIDIRSELLERAGDLFDALKRGAVHAVIGQRYQLADAAQAHRDLESRRTMGSSIILVSTS
jgi:NADPH:quinone reductase